MGHKSPFIPPPEKFKQYSDYIDTDILQRSLVPLPAGLLAWFLGENFSICADLG